MVKKAFCCNKILPVSVKYQRKYTSRIKKMNITDYYFIPEALGEYHRRKKKKPNIKMKKEKKKPNMTAQWAKFIVEKSGLPKFWT